MKTVVAKGPFTADEVRRITVLLQDIESMRPEETFELHVDLSDETDDAAADVFIDGMNPPPLPGYQRQCVKAMLINDALLEKIDDAIEDVLFNHEPRDNDSACSCGAANNMDGDVLHGHRMGALSAAVRGALGVVE